MMKQEESLIRTVWSVIFGHNQLSKNILPVHVLYCSWLSGYDILELALQMQYCKEQQFCPPRATDLDSLGENICCKAT